MALSIRVLTALLVAALVTQTPAARAAVIAGWDFSGLTDGGPDAFSATTSDAAVTVGGLARTFAGAQANAGADTFGSNGLVAQNKADAITFGSYLTFSITTSQAGVSLSDIAAYNTWIYDYDPVATPPSVFSGAWQYSIDATNFTDIGTSFLLGTTAGDPGNSQSALTLTALSNLQSMPSGTQVDFRFIIWGAGYGANYAGFNDFQVGDDLIVNGTVPVPEPSTAVIGLAAVAVGLVAARLRRSVK